MAAWIDAPDWSSQAGRNLRKRLGKVIPQVTTIESILPLVGIELANHPFNKDATATAVWLSVTTKEGPFLPALLKYLASTYEDLRPDIEPLLASNGEPSGIWYRVSPPEQARLFGPLCRWSLIARADLGDLIASVLGDTGMVVLDIRGRPGMGKSHSSRLLAHILEAEGSRWTLGGLDVQRDWPAEDYATEKVGVREFMGRLSSSVGMSSRFDEVVDQTDLKRLARELVTAFVGRYTATAGQPPRVLLIDGLDRQYLDQESINVAIAQLAGSIVGGRLRDVRLVLTGYGGAFDTEVADARLEDSAVPFTRGELYEFFDTVAMQVKQPMTPAKIKRLVAETLKDASLSDHRAIGSAASQVARIHFGAPA